MIKPVNIVVSTIIIFTGITGCENADKAKPPLPPVRVQAYHAVVRDVPEQYSFSGTLEGIHRATLSTKLMGRITSMPFDIGTPVRQGQIILTVGNNDIAAKREQVKAQRLEAQAAFQNAERQYERMKNLVATQSASKKEMDDVETMYRMASAKVKAVDEMEKEIDDVLGYSELRSPLNGFIVGKMVQQGDLASPGMPLVTVEDVSILVVVVKVPESEIYLFGQGDTVRAHIDAVHGEVAGVVTQINASGDAASRQFDVKVRLSQLPKQTAAQIRSGMYARITLEKGTAPRLTIPREALVEHGQLEGLFVLSDKGTARLRWIRTGKSTGSNVEILSGLRVGETVLLPASEPYEDGQPVEVIQ